MTKIGQRFLPVILGAFAVVTLVAAQLMLSSAIHGTNFAAGDGKAAQAAILAGFKFSNFLQINNITPVQGLGGQALPINIWANPVYWPFAFASKEVATDIAAAIALGVFATAGYLMARCFDVPPVPSAIGAQLCIVLFAPALFILELSTVFCLMVGNAVVYAPHMIALGLLARIEPGSWRRFGLLTGGIVAPLFYSLYCDPLWSMVHGIAWMVPFAVVTFGQPRLHTIVLRAAALGCCVLILLVTGAAEYIYTLPRYTARWHFPALADRPRGLDLTASALFYSSTMKHVYMLAVPGWLLGILLLRGRARLLAVAGAASFIAFLAYGTLYLLLNTPWRAPLPVYVEHALFSLFVISAVAGYGGALGVVMRSAGQLAQAMLRRVAISWSRFQGFAGHQYFRSGLRFAALAAAFVALAIVPAKVAQFAVERGPAHADRFQERWPPEPELLGFLQNNIGLTLGQPFRGSAHFFLYDNATMMTIASTWARGIPTVSEYSQLVTPQSTYVRHAFLDDTPAGLNWFYPGPGRSWFYFWKAMQIFGVRYYGAQFRIEPAEQAKFPTTIFPHRPAFAEPGFWYVYEVPRPNVGDYSPTVVTTAAAAAEIVAKLRQPDFDFARQAVITGADIDEPLVPARNMRMSPIRGGLHVSGDSEGTSLVVLPQQFSHCLRARDPRVRLVRANLMLMGVIFSGHLDTEILFDYGIFTPRCRYSDLADMARLDLQIDARAAHLKDERVFPDWPAALARLAAAANAIK